MHWMKASIRPPVSSIAMNVQLFVNASLHQRLDRIEITADRAQSACKRLSLSAWSFGSRVGGKIVKQRAKARISENECYETVRMKFMVHMHVIHRQVIKK
jgi:hypothetical protein